MIREAYTDGACRGTNPGNQCAIAWAYYEDGVRRSCFAETLEGVFTNNQAEYEALVHLLQNLDWCEITGVTIYCDSKLVVNQVKGLWQVRDALIVPCMLARRLMQDGAHKLVHVKGHAGIEGNEYCDKLCNDVLDEAAAKETISA